MSTVYMKLNEGPYRMISSGTKTVEVRLYDEKRRTLKEGDIIIFGELPSLQNTLCRRISRVVRFGSFAELFRAYPNEAVGCGEGDNAGDFTHAMRKYYTEADEKKYGVCAIELLPCDNE